MEHSCSTLLKLHRSETAIKLGARLTISTTQFDPPLNLPKLTKQARATLLKFPRLFGHNLWLVWTAILSDDATHDSILQEFEPPFEASNIESHPLGLCELKFFEHIGGQYITSTLNEDCITSLTNLFGDPYESGEWFFHRILPRRIQATVRLSKLGLSLWIPI